MAVDRIQAPEAVAALAVEPTFWFMLSCFLFCAIFSAAAARDGSQSDRDYFRRMRAMNIKQAKEEDLLKWLTVI